MRNLQIEQTPIHALRPHRRNARTHSKKQIRQIADSIQAVGFTAPVLVDEDGVLLAGHGRLEAAKLLGLKSVPAIVLTGLSEARKRALLLADNRIAQSAGWDRERLAGELLSLPDLLVADGLDITVTGFEPAEIDNLLADFEEDPTDPADTIDPTRLSGPAVTRADDLWQLGKHRLLCGDARKPQHLKRLMGGEPASMAFLDPPYNVRVRDIVGRGQIKHQEFAMASGEMAPPVFTNFLTETLTLAAHASVEGAVHFVCMDWRHIGELAQVGRVSYGAMLNLIAWVKSNAGQGSFYRSQHELIGVFRVGDSPHLNTIELGRHGRSRSNVWKYAGVNTFRAGRMDDLRAHPTVKPVALVADAIKDCTQRNEQRITTNIKGFRTAFERVKRRREVFGFPYFGSNDSKAKAARRGISLAHFQHRIGAGSVGQDCQRVEIGKQVAQDLQAFASDFGLLERQAGDVSAGPRKRCDEASADRVSRRGEYNRNCCCGPLCSGGCRVRVGNYNSHLEPDEFGGDLGDALVASVCPAVLNRYRSTFDPTEFVQSLNKSGSPLISSRGCGGTKKADDRRFGRLLPART
jgi:ParB-like chromosome segregation protein Spo0J